MEVEDRARGDWRTAQAEREVTGDNAFNPGMLKRIAIVGLIAPGAFLFGFVPMWLTSEGYESEVRRLTKTLRPSVLQNSLATATMKAHRGEFESSLHETSGFFTDLRTELERSESSFATEQREGVRSILQQRDETITMLARSDPGSVDRLTDLYFNFTKLKNSAVPERDSGQNSSLAR